MDIMMIFDAVYEDTNLVVVSCSGNVCVKWDHKIFAHFFHTFPEVVLPLV